MESATSAAFSYDDLSQLINNFDPWEWFSFSLYFERRLTPFYERYETDWPAPLQNWDLRLRLGIEYTYLNFEINGGSTPTHLAPGG